MQNQTRNMQTPTTTQTMQTTQTTQTMQTMQTTQTTQTMQTTQTVEYDFENDDDAFYDLIEFGIASNGGRLSIW